MNINMNRKSSISQTIVTVQPPGDHPVDEIVVNVGKRAVVHRNDPT
jgi:hypothetical protein